MSVKTKHLTEMPKNRHVDNMRMTKKTRAEKTFAILDAISPPEITFLKQTDPFRLLISVILSAQTTDRQVNEVAVELFATFPDANTLAKAEIETVKSIIRSTGYFNAKAKHIIATSQALVERHDGRVPFSMKELTELPGVGRKTASVILGQLAHQPAIIVDTHFGRVVRRLGLVESKDPVTIEQEVATLLPPEQHYRYSMIVNLHGRQVCHAKKPLCSICPLAPFCKSYPIQ
jgi:endonuclease-3